MHGHLNVKFKIASYMSISVAWQNHEGKESEIYGMKLLLNVI